MSNVIVFTVIDSCLFPEAVVYTFNYRMWQKNITVCNQDILHKLKAKHYFQKGTVKNRFASVDIYINDPKEDWISREIKDNNGWEPWVFNTIYKHIGHDPDIGLIDLGANLGAISFQVANLGRHVLAVEATYQNTQHLCLSVAENNFRNKITVIHNAISNNHEDVMFVLPSKGEFALGFVEQAHIRNEESKRFGTDTFKKITVPIKSTTLNDLVDLPEFRAVPKFFVKMDVQGVEHKVIEGAEKFFKTGKFVGLYMEWTYHRNATSGEYMLKKFREWNLEPFDCNEVLKDVLSDIDKPCVKMDVRKSGFWGDDILWLPRKR